MIKILHIITGLDTGGAERMLVKLINQTKNDIQHFVISLKNIGTQGEELRSKGIPIFETGIKKTPFVFKKLRKVLKYINEVQPNLIQGWMYHGNLTSVILGKMLCNYNVIYNVRSSLTESKIGKLSTRFIIKLNAIFSKHTAGIIYNSYHSCMQHKAYGFSSSNSLVIPNGFDINIFAKNQQYRNDTKCEYDLPNNKLIITFVGRNNPVKDINNLLYAIQIVVSDRDDVFFLIVGRGFQHDKKFKELILKLKISESIKILDEVEQVEMIWNASDICVLPSKSEAFPNVLGEAMSCEVPCIATDVGDCKYIVGNTGIIVPPENSLELSNAIKIMASLDSTERANLGKEARQRILNKFSIERVSLKYLSYYLNIYSNCKKC